MNTPERLLDVAEDMFSEAGYRAVSLRSITKAAGANMAAVHYHFGSKEKMLEKIFELRCATINDERLRLLDACGARPDAPPVLEQILHAYLWPALVPQNDDRKARRFMRLRSTIAHEHAELSQKLVARHFNKVSGRFIDALRAELDHLPAPDFFWRFHFLLGAQHYTAANPGRIQVLSNGVCDPSNAAVAVVEMIRFAAAGFRAPAGRPPSESDNAPCPAVPEVRP